MSPWSTGERTFTIVNAPISDSEEHAQTLSACALLIEDQIAPLLFRSLEPPTPSPNPANFYVASAGNKGAGMFAARDIPAGTLILVDRPVAVVPSNIEAPEWKRAAFDALIPRISAESRDALLALANVHPVAERPVVEGIALTNAFGIEFLPSLNTTQEYGALFPSISRANHCCGLNTAIKWDAKTFSVCMYALRAVRAGEEIHNQYIDVLAPRAERRAQLARYDFTCMCPHCDLPSEEAAARSDAARKELRDWRHLHPRFEPWSEDLCRADDTIIVSSLRALDLIEQEGLYGMSVPFLEDIALSYALLGDEVQFRVWAEKVVLLCAGQDPKRADKFGRLLEDPRRYKRWGWRAKQRHILETQKRPSVEVDMVVPW
ncbi:SET domain-containing protein [Mycena kentingensis (nom. inval.)]|nr:SET domain-containing protein [Mycena kentingensis (nom. inval.)]